MTTRDRSSAFARRTLEDDHLGNKYVVRAASCIHFTEFRGFSSQSIAHEHWLEAVAAEQACREADLSAAKAVSRCFKCNEQGHWARDCPTSKQMVDPAEPSSSNAEPSMSKAAIVKKEISRKPYKPRVLSKAPPRHQPSAKDAFQRVG